jgi:hypothetical protein
MQSRGLPCRVKTALRANAMGAHNQAMADLKANVSSSNNIIRHASAKQFDEPSPQSAAAIQRVLRT